MRASIGALLAVLLLSGPVAADPAYGPSDDEMPTDETWLLHRVVYIHDLTPEPGFAAGGHLGNGRRDEPGHVAAAAAAGIDTDELIVLESTVSDARNVNRIAVHGVSAASSKGADEAAMLDAILAWQILDWEQRFGSAPEHASTAIAGKTVICSELPIDAGGWPYPYPYSPRTTQPTERALLYLRSGKPWHDFVELTEDSVQCLYAHGDSAIAATALDHESAVAFFEVLP